MASKCMDGADSRYSSFNTEVDKSYVPSQHFGLPPFSVETHLYSLTGFRKVMDMEKNEIHTDEQLEA